MNHINYFANTSHSNNFGHFENNGTVDFGNTRDESVKLIQNLASTIEVKKTLILRGCKILASGF